MVGKGAMGQVFVRVLGFFLSVGLVTFCVETAFYSGLLKERQTGG